MMSSFEKIVHSILLRNGVDFVQEKQFKDLRNGLYRFDFFLPGANAAIEVNGQQHYIYTKNFHKKKSDFTKAQERDRQKIQYCLAHNIKLYIIPYWEADHLKSLKDLFQQKFLATDKFHNDIVWRQQNRKT